MNVEPATTAISTPSRAYLRLAVCGLLVANIPLYILGRQPGTAGLYWALSAGWVAVSALVLWIYLVITRHRQPASWALYRDQARLQRLAPLELLLGIVGVVGNVAIFIGRIIS